MTDFSVHVTKPEKWWTCPSRVTECTVSVTVLTSTIMVYSLDSTPRAEDVCVLSVCGETRRFPPVCPPITPSDGWWSYEYAVDFWEPMAADKWSVSPSVTAAASWLDAGGVDGGEKYTSCLGFCVSKDEPVADWLQQQSDAVCLVLSVVVTLILVKFRDAWRISHTTNIWDFYFDSCDIRRLQLSHQTGISP